MQTDLRNYMIVTGGYWAFTITDGAIRMLIVLFFHQLGYSPWQVAMLFLFYEFFGIVTNLVGGWLGARIGLNLTMHIGMALQVVALAMLMVPESWLTVIYVMLAQALSGIAKDLNKMSAKASVKMLLPEQGSESRLFKWVAVLTGSKNALKGAGFFIGAALLQYAGFRGALMTLAVMLLIVLLGSIMALPAGLGKAGAKPGFASVFSKSSAVNFLSAARFFLFGSRDVWFVVALPVYLYTQMQWSFMQVGAFLAAWIIAYGFIQAAAPRLVRHSHHGRGPGGDSASLWAFSLAFIPALLAVLLYFDVYTHQALLIGLFVYAFFFALNSAIHSFLIVSWSDRDKVSMNVGFYYMANAGGRLTGTALSGWIYQTQGLIGCLIVSSAFVLMAALLSRFLPVHTQQENTPVATESARD